MKDLRSFLTKYTNSGVFYMPSFGPVYSQESKIDQFITDVLGYWEDKTFLDYDRGKRWFSRKEEYVCKPWIKLDNNELYLPVVNTRNGGSLKIFVYPSGDFSERYVKTSKNLAKKIGSRVSYTRPSLITFEKPFLESKTRKIYFKNIGENDKEKPKGVSLFGRLDPKSKRTFSNLAKEEDLFGSQMLWKKYISCGKEVSDLFVVVENSEILGMIGPMDTISDFWGKRQLIPPYFEVSRHARKKGVGTELWKAAMSWGFQKGAKYLLIQAEQGEAADYFYQNTGLLNCGEFHEIFLVNNL